MTLLDLISGTYINQLVKILRGNPENFIDGFSCLPESLLTINERFFHLLAHVDLGLKKLVKLFESGTHLRKYTAINTTIKYTIKESIHPTNNTLSDALPHNVRLIAMLSSKVRTSAASRLSGQNAQD